MKTPKWEMLSDDNNRSFYWRLTGPAGMYERSTYHFIDLSSCQRDARLHGWPGAFVKTPAIVKYSKPPRAF